SGMRVCRLEQFALLLSCSSQAAPGALSDDVASPVPGLAGTFRPPNSPSLIRGLKSPTHDAPLAGWGKGCVFKCLAGKRCGLRCRTNRAAELRKPLIGRRKERPRV